MLPGKLSLANGLHRFKALPMCLHQWNVITLVLIYLLSVMAHVYVGYFVLPTSLARLLYVSSARLRHSVLFSLHSFSVSLLFLFRLLYDCYLIRQLLSTLWIFFSQICSEEQILTYLNETLSTLYESLLNGWMHRQLLQPYTSTKTANGSNNEKKTIIKQLT